MVNDEILCDKCMRSTWMHVGSHRHDLNTHGHTWTLHGNTWAHMDTMGMTWKHMGTHEHDMDTHVHGHDMGMTWKHMDTHEHDMDIHGDTWMRHEHTWTHAHGQMETHGQSLPYLIEDFSMSKQIMRLMAMLQNIFFL